MRWLPRSLALVSSCSLALLPGLGVAGMSSWTSAAFRNDPAECSRTDGGAGEVCAPGAVTSALDEFPYWKYQASGEGGGTHWFLGSSQGHLWSISCNHCGMTSPQRNFTRGPWSGQVFDSVNWEGTLRGGAYRQFNRKDGLPNAKSTFKGDVLYRYRAKAGEALPDVPMMSLLEDLDDLQDGTLMLSIGSGERQTHDQLGWFAECGETAASGGPARHACCRPERVAGQYGPESPRQHASAVPYTERVRVNYGGEGDFAACTAAGLRYLGPVWARGAGINWSTWEFRRSYLAEYGPNPDGLLRLDIVPAVYNAAVVAKQPDSPVALGFCSTAESRLAGGYRAWSPPVNLVKTHLACSFDRVKGVGAYGVTLGDSGAATWAYVPKRPKGDRWVFVGAGQTPISKTLNLIRNRAQFERWVLGRDGDE